MRDGAWERLGRDSLSCEAEDNPQHPGVAPRHREAHGATPNTPLMVANT
jgi:hypothetical protein